MRLKNLEREVELMSLSYNLDEKIAKKQKILRALKKKYSLKKRQQRKRKLIKLGTLFSIADLLEESQEKMVAYLEKYLLLDDSKKKEFFQVGSELLAKENESFYEKHPEFSRKKILFLMIRKAALLEKLKIQMEDPKIILGYLSHYKLLSEIEKKELEKRGYELFIKDNNQNRENTISDEEKLKLLKLSILHNIDITKILKEEYNSTIHSLKKSQSEKLLRSLGLLHFLQLIQKVLKRIFFLSTFLLK